MLPQSKKIFLSRNGAKATGYLYAKEWNWTPNLYYIKKLTQSGHRSKTSM